MYDKTLIMGHLDKIIRDKDYRKQVLVPIKRGFPCFGITVGALARYMHREV